MSLKLVRIAYVSEFLLAMAAIFIVWPEVGGEAALEAMHWGWKLGLSVALAIAAVGFTAALAADERLVTLRAGRWLALIVILLAGIGWVTYYYYLQEDSAESDDNSTISCNGSPELPPIRV